MKFKLTILLLSLLVLSAYKSFADGVLKSAHIHWSTSSAFLSSDHRWMLDVKPSYSEGDSADVYASRADSEARLLLFKLQRDAEVYWPPDQDQVVILDEKSSNEYRLLIFNLKRPSEKTASTLNGEIVRDIKEHLGSNEQIVYYFPGVARWIGKAASLVTVGAVTVHNGTGPFTAHCFGYVADLKSQKIMSELSKSNLKEKYGESCQIWP